MRKESVTESALQQGVDGNMKGLSEGKHSRTQWCTRCACTADSFPWDRTDSWTTESGESWTASETEDDFEWYECSAHVQNIQAMAQPHTPVAARVGFQDEMPDFHHSHRALDAQQPSDEAWMALIPAPSKQQILDFVGYG